MSSLTLWKSAYKTQSWALIPQGLSPSTEGVSALSWSYVVFTGTVHLQVDSTSRLQVLRGGQMLATSRGREGGVGLSWGSCPRVCAPNAHETLSGRRFIIEHVF